MDNPSSLARKKMAKQTVNKLKAASKQAHRKEEERELDRDLESTFPASDPITKY